MTVVLVNYTHFGKQYMWFFESSTIFHEHFSNGVGLWRSQQRNVGHIVLFMLATGLQLYYSLSTGNNTRYCIIIHLGEMQIIHQLNLVYWRLWYVTFRPSDTFIMYYEYFPRNKFVKKELHTKRLDIPLIIKDFCFYLYRCIDTIRKDVVKVTSYLFEINTNV